jgi:hypothetical protein
MPTLRDRITRLWRHPSAPGTTTLATDGHAGSTVVGEAGLADMPMRTPVGVVPSGWWPTYTLGSEVETQSNYAKTRALFHNRLPPYRLASGFSRPIINATAGFVGIPTPTPSEDDPDAQEVLQDQWERWMARLYLATRNSFRDGDSFVRITRDTDRIDPSKTTFNLRLLRPDNVYPELDPMTGDWVAVEIHHFVQPPKDAQFQQPYLLIERITPQDVTVKLAENQHAPNDVNEQFGGEGQSEPNQWGLIPIVQFRNEAEEDTWGVSDLEALDPIFRAYHDTLLLGLSGIQLFAKPKIKLHVTDQVDFLRRNFPEALAGRPINFQGREVLVLVEGEEAAYITADPGTAGVQTLLELLFYCIVQTSETPEFVFGTAVASSKASVSEQQVPFARKIERKRMQLTEPMQQLAGMFLSMATTAGLISEMDSLECELEWPEVTPRDEQSTAATLKTLLDAFTPAIQAGLVSAETANEYLRHYIPDMLEWDNPDEDTDEQRRIVEGLEFLDSALNVATPIAGQPGSGLDRYLQLSGATNNNGSLPPTNGTVTSAA